MKRKVIDIVNRVQKRKALGIIYNIPKNDEGLIHNKLADEHHLILRGKDVYTNQMLNYRLGYKLKIKHFSFDMMPALIDSKVIVITGADIIKDSYARVIEDCNKYRIPLMLLMNKDQKMSDLRKLPVYNKILTIEQNYQTL